MKQTILFGAAVPAGENSRTAARRLLARSVREAWGWTQLPALARGERGKPFFPESPQRHFNLSHTRGLCLCALSEAGPVGVDIEQIRPRRADLPRYVMSEEEFSAFDGSWEEFYKIWTLKEAYCKYLGASVFPPRAVPAPPPVPWRCFSGEGWRAALCADPGDVIQPAAERPSRRPCSHPGDVIQPAAERPSRRPCSHPGDVIQPAAERPSRRPCGHLPERIVWVDSAAL